MKNFYDYKDVTTSLDIHYSTTKDGNMSSKFGQEKEVILNREKFFETKNISNACFLSILHSDIIYNYTENDILKSKIETDAIITDIKNIFFYLAYGDCSPFIIFDIKNNKLGYAHLSWHSICKSLHIKLLKKMMETYNSNIEDLICIIGPSIKSDSYRLADPAQLKMSEWDNYVYKNNDNMYSVDLNRFIIDDILKFNFKEKNIYNSDIDTGSDDNYYSHYRSVNNKDYKEGRFIFGARIK